MKTTEVFVEQVIIGGLVMLIGYILFQPQIHARLQGCATTLPGNQVFIQISLGALLAGAAYLIGIVYDRFTDTMFQDLELDYALKGIKSATELGEDPYPETDYRMALLQYDAAAQREDYFRRRLRLTRAFATLIPGITVATVLCISRGSSSESWYKFEAAVIPVAYLLAFLSKNTDCQSIRGQIPRKTNDKEKTVEYWQKHGSEAKSAFWRSIRSDSACLILFVIFMSLAAVQACLSARITLSIIMLAGTILAALVTWCWWRIYHTYFAFIKNFYQSGVGNKSK
jgi:hypothetical protein